MHKSDLTSPAFHADKLRTLADTSTDYLGAVFARIGHRIGRAIVSMQYARMLTVLSEMPDSHLAVHGITRDEIPEYAAELVGYDRT